MPILTSIRPSAIPSSASLAVRIAAAGVLMAAACPLARAQGDAATRPVRLAAADLPAPVAQATTRPVVRTVARSHRQAVFGTPSAPVYVPASADRSDPAPVPNPDLFPPNEPTSLRVQGSPSLFEINNAFRGDGYPYGATPQGLDDKHASFIPGLNVQVPLKQ